MRAVERHELEHEPVPLHAQVEGGNPIPHMATQHAEQAKGAVVGVGVFRWGRVAEAPHLFRVVLAEEARHQPDAFLGGEVRVEVAYLAIVRRRRGHRLRPPS